MTTLLSMIWVTVGTFVLGSVVILAQLFGVKPKRDGIYIWARSLWGHGLVKAAGIKIVVHNPERISGDTSKVYIANHVSWYDTPVLLETLPNFGFVAKRELEKVPLFGKAAKAVGVIYIDRVNHQAAFGAYEDAAKRMQSGESVVVYAEGTRGESYPLRPFKKGPFVLAIGAGVPIVPVVIYGTIAVNPRGSMRANPGTVHVHILEPISTEGLTYDDRDTLANTARLRMADTLREIYGVNPALNDVSNAPTSLGAARVSSATT
ncbi:MAG: lysophospholipid acyltransferase family protein [Gemmatimonas sp.]